MRASPCRSRARLRVFALVGTAAALAAGLATGPIAHADGRPSSITVLLKAPHPKALSRLATEHGLTHDQRIAALTPLVPSPAAHARVVAALASRGFSITHQTAWTIDATAPATRVASAFGNGAHQEMTRVPPALSDDAAIVLSRSDAPAIFHPRATCAIYCHDGRHFRNAYSSPTSVLRKGNNPNGPLTIATIQLPLHGGWNQSDLTRYAESVGLPDPVASGQYKQYAVDGTSVPAATTHEGGADEEVDLDQESILSTSPKSNQRAYFDTNPNTAAYADSLSQVFEDVTQGPNAMDGGDPKIAALSTSWGTCESEFSRSFAFPGDTIKAVGAVLQALNAAGVTVFAASGDNGIYDCGDSASSTKIAVDYPASDPRVVAVGGTRLKFVGNSAANDGTNWFDTGWKCVSAETCQGSKPADTGGSGGGASRIFKQPTYQQLGLDGATYKTTTGKKGSFAVQKHRLVPDIAADGDPKTGFATLTTDPGDAPSCAPPLGPLTCKPKIFGIGGTSLAAPAAAAMFTDMLSEHGLTAGVGDIHGALYSAYASHRGVFRDVTKGRNGAQADVDARAAKKQAAELPVNARKGFDTVTGLGAVLWPALAGYVLTPEPPILSADLSLATPGSAKHPTRVRARWMSELPKKNGSLAASADVTVTEKGVPPHSDTKAQEPPKGGLSFPGAYGKTYSLSVIDYSLSHQPSNIATDKITVPFDDSKFSYHGNWKRVDGKGDFGGSRKSSSRRGNVAKVRGTGHEYSFGARTGPAYGKFAVFRGGTKLGEYDLYSAKAGHATFTFFGDAATPKKSRAFELYVTGRKNPLSSGTTVNVDSFTRS
ncbi:MAG: S8 family serine peptidase [Frankiaceae bacterium]|nr:S8 family serine peptidase [Frankiaceae bacterium]